MATDAFTGLKDIQSFNEEFNKIENKNQIRLVRIDIIHLKSVNRQYGFDIGDLFLKTTAERISTITESVYRTGPVSFMMLLNKTDDIDGIYQCVTEPIATDLTGRTPKIRMFDMEVDDSDTFDNLMDTFKYITGLPKLLQKRRVSIDSDLKRSAEQEVYLLDEILFATANETYEVYYQPVIDTVSGKCVTAEALTRLNDRNGKPIYPDMLFSFAERKHLNQAITEIILKKVSRFLAKHYDLNISSVSVNMTPDEILNQHMLEMITDTLNKYGVPLNKIRLEMTERTIMHDPSATKEIMRLASENGTGFYLDDFGTGYSNLSSVINMDFEAIKLDKSLIYTLGDEKHDEMIALLIKMIHLGDAKVIAEGIETEAQMKFARENKIDRIQGYYYSRPLPEDEFVAFVEKINK